MKSFRGEEIPEVIKKHNFQVADSNEVINKVMNMASNGRNDTTIEAVNFDGQLANVKLSTGDVVPVETAIALADNHLLKGYTTGRTMRGGKTLRSVPSTDENNTEYAGIYSLPRF